MASSDESVDFATELGSELKQLRNKRRWTQQELATRAGVSDGFIALLESGRRRPKPVTLRKLTEVLGCNLTQQQRLMDLLVKEREDGSTATLRPSGSQRPAQRPGATGGSSALLMADKDEMRHAARRLLALAQEQNELLAQVMQVGLGLDETWKGAAATAYREALERCIASQRSAAEALTAVGQTLVKVADHISSLDSEIAAAFQG
jgi:WXG100 family type VII secretion target